MGHSETLTSKQQAAIEALLSCPTVSDAAVRVGVNRRTLSRWLNEPAFTAALADAKLGAQRHATRRLAGALDKAVTTVLHLAESSEDEPTRLRAALAVASMQRDIDEVADLAARIAALEART